MLKSLARKKLYPQYKKLLFEKLIEVVYRFGEKKQILQNLTYLFDKLKFQFDYQLKPRDVVRFNQLIKYHNRGKNVEIANINRSPNPMTESIRLKKPMLTNEMFANPYVIIPHSPIDNQNPFPVVESSNSYIRNQITQMPSNYDIAPNLQQ